MTQYSSWDDVKRRRREQHPEVTDAEWAQRKQAARLGTEAYVLGHHLRELREMLELSQAQVAASLGISQARVSQIERGEVHNLETMQTYAAGLGAKLTLTLEYQGRTFGAA